MKWSNKWDSRAKSLRFRSYSQIDDKLVNRKFLASSNDDDDDGGYDVHSLDQIFMMDVPD